MRKKENGKERSKIRKKREKEEEMR